MFRHWACPNALSPPMRTCLLLTDRTKKKKKMRQNHADDQGNFPQNTDTEVELGKKWLTEKISKNRNSTGSNPERTHENALNLLLFSARVSAGLTARLFVVTISLYVCTCVYSQSWARGKSPLGLWCHYVQCYPGDNSTLPVACRCLKYQDKVALGSPTFHCRMGYVCHIVQLPS